MRFPYLLAALIPFILVACKEDSVLPEEVNISGSIYAHLPGSNNEDDAILLSGVKVKLLQDGEQIESVEDANFRFEGLEAGRSYTIVPEKVDDVLNNVTTVDITLLEQYLENEADLTIYQKVAADMDRSYFISQDDLVILSECTQTPMMMYCLDWRFIHEDCSALDQSNLINEIHYKNLSSDQIGMRIYGINSGNLTQ
jgi:hypothetical protein